MDRRLRQHPRHDAVLFFGCLAVLSENVVRSSRVSLSLADPVHVPASSVL
jgi:hypothetical protein